MANVTVGVFAYVACRTGYTYITFSAFDQPEVNPQNALKHFEKVKI